MATGKEYFRLKKYADSIGVDMKELSRRAAIVRMAKARKKARDEKAIINSWWNK